MGEKILKNRTVEDSKVESKGIKKWGRSILNKLDKLFFPNNIKCLLCGRDLPSKQNIEFCDKCLPKLEKMSDKCCARCGANLVGEEKFCLNCQNNELDFDIARSVFKFDGEMKKLIHNFKYNNKPYISSTLAFCMADLFNTLKWKVNFVIPVPSSKETLKERGYNQAELLAKEFCELTNLELNTQILRKIKHTQQQANLGFKERKENLSGSFDIDLSWRKELKGKTILLIDDVITSCSTISECAKILKKRGAARVLVLAVARANYKIPVQNDLKNAKSFV